MTSVKAVLVDEPATAGRPGRGRFRFSDDYSVFDWGRMPDAVPGKGASLCAMGAHSFEVLDAAGVPTHYRGVLPPGQDADEPVPLPEAADPPREMAIDLARVPALPREGRRYDYDAYHEAGGDCYLVPLEVVFRNTVPVGSSLRRRTDPADHGLAFEDWPDEAVALDEPVVEFSTKLEESDRYLDREEADRVAGRADLDDLAALAREVNRLVTETAAAAGFDHQDGKLECIYVGGAATAAGGGRAGRPAGGEVRVADVVGTFDENRFAYDGQQVSKEVLRQFYRRTQPAWVDAVADAKVEAKRRGVADWRSLCEVDPDPLPGPVLGAARDLYAAGANAYVGRELLDAPPVEEAVAAAGELREG